MTVDLNGLTINNHFKYGDVTITSMPDATHKFYGDNEVWTYFNTIQIIFFDFFSFTYWVF
jgi:hypothetical protein